MPKKKKIPRKASQKKVVQRRQQKFAHRHAPDVYLLEPLFSLSGEGEVELRAGTSSVIRGDLAQYVVISVPPTIDSSLVQAVMVKLENSLQRPVLAVTHNIEFVKTTKLTGSEARELLRREVPHAENTSGGGVEGSGDRPRLGDDGDGSLVPGDEDFSDSCPGAEIDPDNESNQEAVA